MEEQKLAEITNLIGNRLLKHDKRDLCELVESVGLDKSVESILKNIVKKNLYDSYNLLSQGIAEYADNKQEYFNYLYKLEEESKRY